MLPEPKCSMAEKGCVECSLPNTVSIVEMASFNRCSHPVEHTHPQLNLGADETLKGAPDLASYV